MTQLESDTRYLGLTIFYTTRQPRHKINGLELTYIVLYSCLMPRHDSNLTWKYEVSLLVSSYQPEWVPQIKLKKKKKRKKKDCSQFEKFWIVLNFNFVKTKWQWGAIYCPFWIPFYSLSWTLYILIEQPNFFSIIIIL